jgi:hypothetical protein
MPIYLRFDNGRQVETTTLPKKPEGWHKAPAEFSWEKRYRLLEDGSVVEREEADLALELLENAKAGALERVRSLLRPYRRQYAGYSHEKARSYDIQAKAAENVLEAMELNQEPDAQDVALLSPLAEVRSLSVSEMAKLIHSKSQKSSRAIAICEALEDQAQHIIKNAKTQEELSLCLIGFEENLIKTLNQL